MNCGFYLILAFLPAVLSQRPKGWKPCKRSAKDYEACFSREVGNAVKSLISGQTKMGNPTIDPLKLSKLVIPRRNSPVTVDLTFTDLDVTGIKDFKIVNIKNDWKTAKAIITVPALRVQGNYKVDGKVLVLPIVGEGKCNITFQDAQIDGDIAWKKIDKGGKKYIQMDKFLPNLSTKRLYIYLGNLFNGDKALGDNMNVFLDENWDKILEELKPAINEGLSQALTQISNIVLSKIPADQIDIP